jgi:Na+/alanine symporter
MNEEIFIPIFFFAMIVGVVWLFQHFALKKRVEAFTTLRLAIEKGQPLTPDALESMARLGSPIADLRRGIVFVAIALGFASFSTIIGWNAEGEMRDVTRGLYGVATFPLFIGLAFLGLHYFANEKKHRSGA